MTMMVGATWLLRVSPRITRTVEGHGMARLLWQQMLARNCPALRKAATLVDVELIAGMHGPYGDGDGVPVAMPDVMLPQQTAWRKAVMEVWRRQTVGIKPGEKFIMPAVMFQVLLEMNGDNLLEGRRRGMLRPLRSAQVGEVTLLLTGAQPRIHTVWDNGSDRRLAYQPDRWKGYIMPPPLQQDVEMAEALVAMTMDTARKDEAFAMKLPDPYEVAPWLKDGEE